MIALLLPCWSSAQAFDFGTVTAKAEALAEKPYQKPPQATLPAVLAKLDHAQYQSIRFKPADALWGGAKTPFSIEFLIDGGVYRYPVKLNEVDTNGVHPIAFDASLFDYGNTKIDPTILAGAGFSGFRVIYTPAQKKGRHGQASDATPWPALTLQGASYFHARGKGQVDGTSARGLAVDTGLLSGEEFPRFTEFWIERPAASDRAIVIDALMNSKRVTGAYRFVLRPGESTIVDVQARIFLRDYVTKFGVAPLNSMFLFGENEPNRSRDDYRPEVHDSDGLQIASGTGEWLWRPLVDPPRLLITSFSLTNPQGFGLMQRDRDFDDYQDLEARYDRRSSVWVDPKGNWGSGRVELVELPSPNQTNDNVVAFWVPDDPPKPHQPWDIAYRIEWQGEQQTRPPASWVVQTRSGVGYSPTPLKGKGFVVDFAGPALQNLPPDTPMTGVVSIGGNGTIVSRRVVHNDVDHGWRLFVRVHRIDNTKPVELRAYLRSGHNTVSETWSYILPPQ